jgi:STE24 endopeptidase
MAAVRRGSRILLFALLGVCVSGQAPAQPDASATPPPRPAAASANRFDAESATRAYLATVSPEKKARSDAYFEGGYWLALWGFLYGITAMWLLLAGKWSVRMRDLAERVARGPALQTSVYWVQYLLATVVLLFPLTVYEGFLREHRYGLATQTFWPWMGDRLKELALSLVFGGLTVVALYAVVRRAPRTWWIWGALTATALWMFTVLIAPVFVFPLFNRFTPLSDEAIRGPILSLARASGIPAKDVYVSDASRQTTRVSANVSGLFGTLRITLNDNLLKRCSLPEIESVMGHEMGHYVLHHLEKGIVFSGILIVAGFQFLRASFDGMARRYGSRWGIRGPADVAGMPLFAILAATYLFAMTPVINSIIRVQEAEADIFGLNASGQPEGFAEITLKLGEYRKLEPGPLEEVLFYDHPSGRTRILMAMRWKAEHLR